MNKLVPSTAECLTRIRQILSDARNKALQSVNSAMVTSYWHIGREIVEEEQRGKSRADYGSQLLQQISAQLSAEYGPGFSLRNLRYFRQFYLTYAERVPPIGHTARAESRPALNAAEIRHTLCAQSQRELSKTLSTALSWSHYRELLKVSNLSARSFYEVECAKAGWSVRELQRQIGSLLFERLARSRDKEGVLALAQKGHEVQLPSDFVKDPYVLEFVGVRESSQWLETDLEKALIDRLQQFLLELGRDLFFVARQKRITVDGDHFYIDLVFYHRVLRCFLIIDLKLGRLTQEDIGKMLFYTGYYEKEEMEEEENPPIGLILCTDKNEAMVQYTLSKTASKVFASRYQLHLPSEQELANELERERQQLEQQRLLEEPQKRTKGKK